MKEIAIAHLLLQAAAATVLMLVAGISSARQLHGCRSLRSYAIAPQETGTVVELAA